MRKISAFERDRERERLVKRTTVRQQWSQDKNAYSNIMYMCLEQNYSNIIYRFIVSSFKVLKAESAVTVT